jgi:putative heme-binding domain-containing protein
MMTAAAILVLATTTALLAADPPPRPVAAWAAGPLEARVAFDGDVPKAFADALVGTRIVSGADAKADERGTLRIAAARAEGRTLVLATDPHSRDTAYALTLPEPVNRTLIYRLRGVEYALDSGEGTKPLATGVWEGLDSSRLGPDFDRVVWMSKTINRTPKQTRLAMKTLVALPKGKATLKAQASAPFSLVFGIESAKSAEAGGEHRAEITSEVEADVTDLTWVFDAVIPRASSITYRTADDPADRPFSIDQLILPWAPPPLPGATESPVPEALLKGGDLARGAVVFKGEGAKCAVCHKVGGEGGDVGPDLSDLAGRRDRAWVYRQINEPSAVIHPDYVPYTVLTKNGQVLAGIVRAEGADAIKVTNTEGKSAVVAKADLEELKPSATSIMPVGLLGALGEEGVRDLLAFLTDPLPSK